MLFTGTEATVVPAGTLSKFLGSLKHVAKYPRQGGLYITKMKMKARDPKAAGKQSFTRQGARR